MSKSHSSLLVAALEKHRLVRISRRFESSPIRGYVMAVGSQFFLLALVSDRLWFDGFECFRITDVLGVEADPYESFAEAALKKRGQRRPRKSKIDVKSVESILLTASEAFPLVTIHMERKAPDVCYIGRVSDIKKGRVSLLEINPHAKWETEPNHFPLNKITRVSFGGDYEGALHLVAGDATG
jgi:hypothetical protein